MAKKMIDAGIKEAEKCGIPVAIAVSDIGGNLLAFNRMDDALLCSIHIAIDKAFTAVFGKWHTGNWGQQYQSGALAPLFFHDRWITFSAGLPLIKNASILGGIGVSGAVSEDLYIVRAAMKEGGFSLEEVSDAITKIEGLNKKR